MSSVPRIAELVLQGFSTAEIVEELENLKPSSVKVYIRKAISEFTPEQKARMAAAREQRGSKPNVYHRKFSERPVLGPVHIRIGRKLLELRQHHKMSHGEFCEHYAFSNRVMLSAMEQGYHDFTITEVLRIADILGTTIEDLLRPPIGVMAA